MHGATTIQVVPGSQSFLHPPPNISPSESTHHEPEAVFFTLGLPSPSLHVANQLFPPPAQQRPEAVNVVPAESPVCRNIILEEDPQRPVECSDNEDEEGAVGDGLGDEDAEPNEGDEDGDELDGDGGQLEDGNGDPPHKPTSARLPMPDWLLEPFKAHVAECGPAHQENAF